MAPRVFLITGTSSGFGSELVKVVLEKGDTVVATARNPDKLSFEGTNEKNYLALSLDVTDESSIHDAISKTVEKFGRIDVLVNNAGYGLGGEFESLSDKQLRKQMEVNFFGLINVTRAGMQQMRKQEPKGGVIQQVTSIGGQKGVPMFSVYCASKWAVEGFTEAVAQEVKPEWNIKFNCIEPGGFRTDWAGRSMAFGENKTPDYDHIDAEKSMKEKNGTQGGEPAKAAKAMYEVATMDEVPMRVCLGSDAFGAMEQKVKTYGESVKKFEKLSKSCDVDEGK